MGFVYEDAITTRQLNISSQTVNVPLTIKQTGAEKAIFIDQDGNGGAIEIDTEALTAAKATIDITAISTSGRQLNIVNSGNQASNQMVLMHMSHASSAATMMHLHNDGIGNCLELNNDGIGFALDIDMDCNNAAEKFAARINCDNGGGGAAGGIDMSGFAAAEHVFKFVADNNDPTGAGGAATGRVAVNIAGATKYLAYYG